MKRIVILILLLALFSGCKSQETSFIPLGSDYISGQWVAYNEADILSQPTDLYLSLDEDGSVFYWDTTEYGYVCTQFEGFYRYDAAQNAMSVQLHKAEGGATKGELFSVSQRWDVVLIDQDTLQISVELSRFAVGVTMKEPCIIFKRYEAYQYDSVNVVQHKLPVSPLENAEYDPKEEINIQIDEMRWGMSIDDVLSVFPNLTETKTEKYTDVCDQITYSGIGKVLGRNADINAVFLKVNGKTFLCKAEAIFHEMTEKELLYFEKHVVNPHYLGYNIFFYDSVSRWDITLLTDAEMEIYQINQQYLKCQWVDYYQNILSSEMGVRALNEERIYCIEIDATNYLLSTMILQNK